MGLIFSGLLPHPPIVVPAVGGERGVNCRATTGACREFARALVAARPARMLLVSPHSPRQPGSFGLWSGARLHGDLGRFAAAEARVALPNDALLLTALERTCAERSIATWRIPSGPLDHGAVVPLWFLREAGWRGPTSIVSLPWTEGEKSRGTDSAHEFGMAVAESFARAGGEFALVASGDLTHRGDRGAPAGYHPRAAEFDEALEDCLRRGELEQLTKIPPSLRALAAEDAVESCVLVAAAHRFEPRAHRVLSYERPFGVGYLVAIFRTGEEREELAPLPGVARAAIVAWTRGEKPVLPVPTGRLAERAAVFVTLRVRSTGELRGCIGSLQPEFPDLVQEVAARAVAAAANDPRFSPLRPSELDGLTIDVNVLGAAEPAAGLRDLDPRVWGVVVSDDAGRRAVLLPGIAAIKSARQQVEIARRKAGIESDVPVRLERFRTVEIHEEESGQ